MARAAYPCHVPTASTLPRRAGRDGSARRAEPVAGAADGAEQARLAVVLELAAQVADVDVDHVRRRDEVVAPDVLGDLGPAEDAVGVAQEVLQDRVLLAGHLDQPTT